MRMRVLAFAAWWLAAAVGLVASFAWPGSAAPWQAHLVRELSLSDFASSSGTTSSGDDALRAHGAAGARAIELTQSVPPMAATDFAYVRFDAERGGAASQLMLSWQGSAGEGRVPLPVTAGGSATLDLTQVEAWKGEIHSVGVIASPVDYLPAAAWTEATLGLRALRFESRSWRGALGSLATQWLAYRPWTGRSNNTAGTELAGGTGPSLVAFMMSLLLLTVVGLWLLFGRQTWRTHGAFLAALACVVLALWQVGQLSARASSAMTARRAVQGFSGMDLSAQPQLAAAATGLSHQLRQEDGRPRVLVHGQGRFLSEYPAWLLREHDVASLSSPDQLPAQDRIGNALLVLVGPGDWDFQAQTGQLRLGTQTRVARLYFDAGVLKAYRFAENGASP